MPFNVKFVTKVEGQISSKEWLLNLKENLSSDSKKTTTKQILKINTNRVNIS